MKRVVPWSNDEDQRLLELAQAGLSLPEIAVEMGRSISGVRWRAEKLQIKIARGANGMASSAMGKRLGSATLSLSERAEAFRHSVSASVTGVKAKAK
jgi:hypothetical protein